MIGSSVIGSAPVGGTSDSVVVLAPVALDTDEAFGSPTVYAGGAIVSPVSIDTDEAFGTPSLIVVLSPVSIDTDEAFGVPSVRQIYTYPPVSRIA